MLAEALGCANVPTTDLQRARRFLAIIEPRGGRDDISRGVLPAEGFGLVWHQVGVKMPSLQALDVARGELTRGGHEVALSGGNPNTSMFFSADARATLGHYLEYVYLGPERQEFHRQLAHHEI